MVELDKRPLEKQKVEFSEDRYDVLVIPQNLTYRVPPAGARALVLNLATRQFVVPASEIIRDDLVQIYCKPGPAAHEVFTPHTFDRDNHDAFEELLLHFSTQKASLAYGGGTIEPFFYLEFRACVFKEPIGPFKKLLKDSMHVRARSLCRPFEGIPPRPDA